MSWSDTGWVWIVAALFTGGLVKGLSGVGLPMISVPLLALILPVNEAVTLLSLPILFANLLQSTSISREIIGQRWLYCLVIALLAGMVCGSLILSNQSKGITILTGLMIIVFSTLSLAGFHFTLNQNFVCPLVFLPVYLPALRGAAMRCTAGLWSCSFHPYLSRLHSLSVRCLCFTCWPIAGLWLYCCCAACWIWTAQGFHCLPAFLYSQVLNWDGE